MPFYVAVWRLFLKLRARKGLVLLAVASALLLNKLRGFLARRRRFLRGNLDLTPADAQVAYDYIIVGAGSAGAACAHDLARGLPDAKILLLEAGRQDTNKFIHIPATAFLTQHAPMTKDKDLNWGYK